MELFSHVDMEIYYTTWDIETEEAITHDLWKIGS